MRRTKRSGSFWLCLLLNMLLNAEGLIPAGLLLVMHFWRGWPLWWAAVAAGLWLLGLLIWMLIFGWANRCGNTPDPPKPNQNPYSAERNPYSRGRS